MHDSRFFGAKVVGEVGGSLLKVEAESDAKTIHVVAFEAAGEGFVGSA